MILLFFFLHIEACLLVYSASFCFCAAAIVYIFLFIYSGFVVFYTIYNPFVFLFPFLFLSLFVTVAFLIITGLGGFLLVFFSFLV